MKQVKGHDSGQPASWCLDSSEILEKVLKQLGHWYFFTSEWVWRWARRLDRSAKARLQWRHEKGFSPGGGTKDESAQSLWRGLDYSYFKVGLLITCWYLRVCFVQMNAWINLLVSDSLFYRPQEDPSRYDQGFYLWVLLKLKCSNSGFYKASRD